MARVSYVGEENAAGGAAPAVREFAHDGSFENQARALAHSPAVFRHSTAWFWTAGGRRAAAAPGRDRGRRDERSEPLQVLRRPSRSGAAEAWGFRAETVERILEPDVPGLDEVGRLVRDYAQLVTERAWGIRDQAFDALREHFTDRQIVELTVRIGLCGLFNKLNDALQVEFETPAAPASG